MKKCFKCLSVKPRSEFYRHPLMKDGLLGKCRECARKDAAKRVESLSRDPEWVERERARCRLKTAKARAAGKIKQTPNENKQAWRKRNHFKSKAHNIAKRAVGAGKIERIETCEHCLSSPATDMHHFDYSRPIDVVFVCKSCHGILHRKHKTVPIGISPKTDERK